MHEVISTKYRIFEEDGSLAIYVKVFKNGRISIYTNNEEEEFVFKKTTREMTAKIATLLIEASKL